MNDRQPPGDRREDVRSDDPMAPLLVEVRQEQAETLGRTGRELARALDALRTAPSPAHRVEACHDAAERLWYLVIQREAVGLTSHAEVYEHYRVPPEVRLRMGMRRGS